ncbi:MAG: extracellular solute-binding protein [Anaerolineae bacterium]
MIAKKTNIKRLLHVGLLFLMVAMLLTTATQNSIAAQDTDLTAYTDAGIDWQQAAGEEIILGGLEHPWIEALTPLLPQFTELTGIKVTPQIASETEYVTKMPVTLGGGSATPDVFMVWAMGQAVAAKWLEPLDMYYADPKLTDLAWYDEADIFNSARQFPVWPTDKRRYTATITAEAQTLFLRKDLLEEKGLEAPKTFDDLLALAEALKSDDMAGIAMRAKPTGDAVAWPAAGFVFSYGGQIIDENGQAVFDSPEAVAAIEMYAKLLGENGPQGVATYHWYESLNDFMQGKVAISGDSSNFAADIENPEKSTVAGKTLYGAFPQQGNLPSKPNLWHWMIGMNAASEHKTAAWLFIQWATSKPTSLQLGRNGAAPARISTWQDADFKARFGEQAAEAALANLKNADGAVMTRTWFNPKGPEVLDLFAVAVNEVITGSKDAQSALSEAAQTANDEVLSQ